MTPPPFVYTDQAGVGEWREASYATRHDRRPRLGRKGKQLEKQFEVHEHQWSGSWDRQDDPRD